MKGLGLFLAGYNVHFGVRHLPRQRQLDHVCVGPILILQVKIFLNPKRERRNALTLALRRTIIADMILKHIRKQFHGIGMLGNGQPHHQDIGI